MMYAMIQNMRGEIRTDMVLRVADGAYILTDYFVQDADSVAYRQWLAEGGELAEPMTPPSVLVAQINAERDRRAASGFVFNGTRFQSRPSDRENIAGASTLAAVAIMNGAQAGNLRWHGGESDFVWIAEDNSLVPMDAFEMIELGKAAAAWVSSHIFAARALKEAIPVPEDFADDQYWPTT